MPETPHPDREGFGEAQLGDAQSSDPPPDPEMIRDEAGGDEPPEDFRREVENDPSENPPDELERYQGG